MNKLTNKTIRENELNTYVESGELPFKNEVGGKPAVSFDSTSHSYLYNSVEDRDADFDTIVEMY